MALADYAAARHDVRFTRGDDVVETFTFADSDGETLDLTGYTFASQVRNEAGTLVAAFTFSYPEPGQVTRRLSKSVTTTLSDVHYHDLQWTTPSGDVRTLVSGRMIPVAQVTQ